MFYLFDPQKSRQNANMRLVFSDVPFFLENKAGEKRYPSTEILKNGNMTTAGKCRDSFLPGL
jgi:hypothetical protein